MFRVLELSGVELGSQCWSAKLSLVTLVGVNLNKFALFSQFSNLDVNFKTLHIFFTILCMQIFTYILLSFQ